jgi:3-hydroxymyristoyl/3-hydroxydecanoyl-(acyl carrier protein) dehydratase
VHYTVEIKEIGYHPEPYVVADAHMHADGAYIVFFKDMSMQMTGATEQEIELFWRRRQSSTISAPPKSEIAATGQSRPTALYSHEQILEFAVGRPSKAFGEPYRIFDRERKIARLPGPPYCFMDRVTAIEPQPWVLKAGGWVEAQYDLPADAWYFTAGRSATMPFCVLLEIALQPCGWLAAYAGSALKSTKNLKFRNLGGKAVQHAGLLPWNQTLTMRTRITKVSEAADMIIEHFDFEVLSGAKAIYAGNTYFGFFTEQALAQQVGLREAHYLPDSIDLRHSQKQQLIDQAPRTPDEVPKDQVWQPAGLLLPAKALRMIDTIDLYNPKGGPHGLGYVRGYKMVDPDEWFFKAHFYEDPVCPGSLGIESFLQLIKHVAIQRWPECVATHCFEMVYGQPHEWQYRGQVIPANQRVVVDAVITRIAQGPEPLIMADGWLQVDGRYIYGMKNFGIRLTLQNKTEG